jgi:sulfur relay (sulfurtransferase) DsrC/TusE family protein
MMPVTVIADKEVHIDEEGFLTEFDEWDKDLAIALASNIGIDELTEEHWRVIGVGAQHASTTDRKLQSVLCVCHRNHA